MRSDQLLRIALPAMLALLILPTSACTDQFYLSESEVATYSNYLATDAALNQHFSTLQNQAIQLNFDSSNPPHLISTNLLQLMRSTDMVQLETSGPAPVRLDRLNGEIQSQLENWIAGRLQLYTGSNNADARLTQFHDLQVTFQSNPTFTFHPETQSISFNMTLSISINCTIEVNALDSILNFIFSITGNSINGSYPLNIVVNNLQLSGQASLVSPYADAGRVRLQLVPHPGAIQVSASIFAAGSAPGQVKDGVRQLLARSLTSPVDEIFNQKYAYFALPELRLLPATSQRPGSLTVSYRARPETASPAIHLVARAKDGNLYHSRRTSGAWSSYAMVPFPSKPFIGNEPTLVHAGASQLELCATDAKGNLVYGHWRDEAWGNFQTISPSVAAGSPGLFTGKPAVVASAPGQVEIAAQATDGNLWYFRRWNGNWFVPYAVPLAGFSTIVTPPFRDPAIVQVGNKVAIIFVDGKGQLGTIAYDMETNIWGQPVVIATKETVQFAPAAAASGDRRVDLAYVGKSGAPYHRRIEVSMGQNFVAGVAATGISVVGSETALGGTLVSAPVLACSGYGQLELIGRQNNSTLYHLHYVNSVWPIVIDGRVINPGWQSWVSPPNNLLGTPASWTGQVDDFSAVALGTGEVELAAHNLPQLIFHNSFQSARYGRDPWKTVDWRGFESTGGSKFLGKPALAAVDRNFEVAVVGGQNSAGPTVDYALISDSNATSFKLGSTPQVKSNPSPIDPLILSSGPGLVDHIEVGSDGKLYHTQLQNGGPSFFNLVPLPTGITFGSQLSAVGYGNGQIELVAVGSNQKIYLWRYRDATWSTATTIGSGIISNPVLLYVGAGQLELLAVNSDRQAIRWRFSNGAWTSGQPLQNGFLVNPVLFGPSAASSWGDGSVVLTVINYQDQSLYYRQIGPGDEACGLVSGCPAPRVFTLLGGKIGAPPVLTAFSSTHWNILAMGTDHAYYSNWSSVSPVQPITSPPQRDPSLTWSGYEFIGGANLFGLSGANAGRQNFASVAIDQQGRLYINRNSGGRWTGFQPVIGQTPIMQLGSPLFMPVLAAHGG